MAFLHALDGLALLVLVFILRALHDQHKRRRLPYPPGPPPLPLVGNLFDIPKDFSWVKYTEVADQYGEITSFRVFGQTIIVLNSMKAAKDLLEKRGDIYSDRPALPIGEMMGWETFVPGAPYGETWKQERRLLERSMRPAALGQYHPLQERRIAAFLGRMLATPEDLRAHVELLQSELIMGMTYGYELKGHGDRIVSVSKAMNELAASSALPGALLVNHLPFLRHIPAWVPWISYKPLARLGHDMWQEVMTTPIQFVKENMRMGTALPSMALEHLQEAEELKESERDKAESIIAQALGSTYAPGVDTTGAAILNAVLAVLLHPDVQKKAQEEIDLVTGGERLPTFGDRPRMPYVDALCKEALRWKVVTPLSIPHRASQDDIYEGFFIPKDAIVIGNTWGILRDPKLFPEPDAFKPERFLHSNGTLRNDAVLKVAFGYGKRICPGRHHVDAIVFMVIASLLSVFSVEKQHDACGEEIPFNVSQTSSIVSHPTPFPFAIVPRDKKAAELIDTTTSA
ncbi:cytochrome P450 [Gloeopeniophorella convolvens]|nr:cytochrome P450 [Gloeopeniophorella convolvens]